MTNKKKEHTISIVVGSATRVPESFSSFDGEDVISNFDRQVIIETLNAIKGEKLFSYYPGWNFNGRVWWQNNKWLCEVWCYGCWKETFVCDTLEGIMGEVSSEYGYE